MQTTLFIDGENFIKKMKAVFAASKFAQLFLAKTSDGVIGTDEVPLSTSEADTGNVFRYDGQYIYNLDTSPFSTGTWQLKVVLDDGTNHTALVSLR